jgi:hypothetical protein
MFLSGMYHSAEPTPSLDDCLKATQWRIQRQYKARAGPRSGVTFEDFWNGVCDWLARKGQKNNATELQRLVEFPPLPEPEAFDSLSVAVAYWVEAAIAHDHHGDSERSWAALLQCHYFFGMACGPVTALERSSKGGEAQAEAFKQLRGKLIEWLAELPESSFGSVSEVIAAVKPKAEAFKPGSDQEVDGARLRPLASGQQRKRGHGRSTNAAKLIRDWSRNDDDVRAAIERVVQGGIRRGRKKKSAEPKGRGQS